MRLKIKAASVNGTGKSNASARISAGDVDKTSDWSFDADDGNKLLGASGDDWANYAKWFLGEDTSASAETKARYKYPFGKNGKVYRSGLIAIRQRSAQQDDESVYAAAGTLLDKLDGKSYAPYSTYADEGSSYTDTPGDYEVDVDDDEDEENRGDSETGDESTGAPIRVSDEGDVGNEGDDTKTSADEEEDETQEDVEEEETEGPLSTTPGDDDDDEDTQDEVEEEETQGPLGPKGKPKKRVSVRLSKAARRAPRRMYKGPPPMRQRASSLFTVKAVDDEQRIISGIATTPTPDRMGDIMEVDGAMFELPLAAASVAETIQQQPIGQVVSAKSTKAGIPIQAQLAQIATPGTLKDRLDEAWQSIKIGLVKGLSIGFNPVEYNYMEDTGGFRFVKWAWYELSAVTIPANAEASIANVKAFDRTRGGLLMPRKRIQLPRPRTQVQVPKAYVARDPFQSMVDTFTSAAAEAHEELLK